MVIQTKKGAVHQTDNAIFFGIQVVFQDEKKEMIKLRCSEIMTISDNPSKPKQDEKK